MSTKKTTKKVVKKTAQKGVKKSMKKTVKKVVKKGAKKSTDRKHVRALVCADGEHCFWTTDGKVLENLDQLQLAFGSMGDEVFLHHVTKEKNDFADWVEHVLEDASCAKKLRTAKHIDVARTVVVTCLRNYNL